MNQISIINKCPCCEFEGLTHPAYDRMSSADIPVSANIKPPYSLIFGNPSYQVCPCCGFEFGNDDEPGMGSKPASFSDYREDWIADGAKWFDETRRPLGWRPPTPSEEDGSHGPE